MRGLVGGGVVFDGGEEREGMEVEEGVGMGMGREGEGRQTYGSRGEVVFEVSRKRLYLCR